MSDKIKFIVDDLADYTGILNNYSDYIYYLPKKIKVGDEVMYTTQAYTDSLYEKFDNSEVFPLDMEIEEYKTYLNSFLGSFDGQLIYLKPYTYGVFDKDLSTLSDIISEINEEAGDRIHVFETDHFSCALHFILVSLISKYVKEDLSVSELEELCSTLNKSIYSYISFFTKSVLSNTGWTEDPRDFVLFKLQNKEKAEIPLQFESDNMLFYAAVVEHIASDINSKEENCILTLTTYHFDEDKIDLKDQFLSYLEDTKDIQTEFYSKSQSCFAINNDGDFISIH